MNADDIRTVLSILALAFVAYLTLRDDQDERKNWAIFYACCFNVVTLPIINYMCVRAGLWSFTDGATSIFLMPYDIYFLWIIAWAVVPVFFLKYKQPLIVITAVFWLDLLLMPALQELDVLHLNSNWLIGEVALVLLVFIPGYYWALASFEDKWVGFRASLQVVCMVCVFVLGLPTLLHDYDLIATLHFSVEPITFQLFLITAFPGLVAVVDLVQKGKGTPFPYDKTKMLVRTGVYAYIRNPIQWSFTFIFLSMAVYHDSWYLLTGSAISIAYTLAIADVHESPDMERRFGTQWSTYVSEVPSWYFKWKPKGIPSGTIYFDQECTQCSQLSEWLKSKNSQQLVVEKIINAPNSVFQKVTYIDYRGQVYVGISAIAHALEHINLIYATAGWFIRFPLICYLLDSIVYSMGFGEEEQECGLD